MISKIIASQIKANLSKFISLEQIAFLARRQMQDAVVITQECLHYINLKPKETCL